MQFDAQTDLDWLAFRYIADELTTAEVQSFESLLADDQAARDAVVKAVELMQTIRAAQVAPQPPSIGLLSAVSQHWPQHVAWISSSVAALLLVALALNFKHPAPSRISHPDDLAQVWVETTDEPLASDSATVSGTVVDSEEFVTAEPPAWMLEAVRSLHGDDSADSDDASDEGLES